MLRICEGIDKKSNYKLLEFVDDITDRVKVISEISALKETNFKLRFKL